MTGCRIGLGGVLAFGLLGTACAPGPAPSPPVSTNQSSAVIEARESLQWLKAFPCPVLGHPVDVPGMNTEAETRAVKSRNWTYASETIGVVQDVQLQRQEAQAKIGTLGGRSPQRLTNDLRALDLAVEERFAKTGTALVQWTLANWVEMAQLNPDYLPEGSDRHPMLPYVRASTDIVGLIDKLSSDPVGRSYVKPIENRYRDCLVKVQNDFVIYNSERLKGSARKATSPRQVQRMIDRYAVFDSDFSGPGSPQPPVLASLRSRIEELRRAQRPAPTTTVAKATQRPKATQAQLTAAQQFIAAIRRQDIDAALVPLSSDIYMSTPKGSYRGKSRVAGRLRHAFGSSSGGRIKDPTINRTGDVTATIVASQGNALMSFGFVGESISRIVIK